MLRGLQAQQGVSSASLSQVMRGFRGNMRVGKPPAHGATACSLCGCEGSLWRGSWVGSEGTAEGQEPPRRHWRADSDRANRCILEPQQPSHVVPGAPAPPTPRRPEWVSPPTAKPDTSCWLCLVIRGDCWLPAAILRASALTQPDQRTHVPPLCLAGGSSLRVHPGAERGPDWGGRVEKGGAQTSGGRGDPGGHWLCLCLVAALRCVCGLWGPPVFPWTCRESPRTQGSPEVSAASARLPTSICALANPASPTRKIPRSSAVQTLWGKMRHPVS